MLKLISTIFRYVIVAVVFFLLGYCYYDNNNDNNKIITNDNSLSSKDMMINDNTKVSLTNKTSKDDPDLVVDTSYTATINGETVKIPKRPLKASGAVQPSLGSDKTLNVSNEIDLAPVVRRLADAEYKRNWEVSTGLGRSHDGHWYVPIGIQRNYNYDRAVEVSIGVSHDHIENLQVTHKWKF